MHIFNFWTWPLEIIEDIRQWKLVRDAQREEETIQLLKTFKYELRIDKIGRIYTVINIPEELYPFDKQDMVWPWMLEQLKELDEILLRLRLSDLLYPEVTRIPDSFSYLIVLSPSTESLSIWKFLRWSFNLIITILTIWISNSLVTKLTGSTIIEHFLSLFN